MTFNQGRLSRRSQGIWWPNMFATGSIPPPGPLAYDGQVSVPFINRTFDPVSTNNQFPVPTIWVNTSSSNAFVLVSKAQGVAVWLDMGGTFGDVETITTPDAVVVQPTNHNINFLNGTGTTITGSGSNITFNASGGGLSWSVVTSATQAMTINRGYIANRGGGVAFALPTTAAVGDQVRVTTINAGGWSITQAAGQQIQIGDSTTTLGAGGSLASTKIGDSVLLVCTVANTTFLVLSATGNITRV